MNAVVVTVCWPGVYLNRFMHSATGHHPHREKALPPPPHPPPPSHPPIHPDSQLPPCGVNTPHYSRHTLVVWPRLVQSANADAPKIMCLFRYFAIVL
jgi:hypothetical protein